jgi:hypothetical protein
MKVLCVHLCNNLLILLIQGKDRNGAEVQELVDDIAKLELAMEEVGLPPYFVVICENVEKAIDSVDSSKRKLYL